MEDKNLKDAVEENSAIAEKEVKIEKLTKTEKEVKIEKSTKLDVPYAFKSQDQMLYAASCLAAANLGFDMLNSRDFTAKRWIKQIENCKTYQEKTNILFYGIGELSDTDVNMQEVFIQERKHFLDFIKTNSGFNEDIEKYIEIAEAV